MAPAGTNLLLDFTFVVSDARQSTNPRPIAGLLPNPVPVNFQSHVVRYDMFTRTLIGPVLYSSPAQTVPLTDNLSFVQYSFAPDIEVVRGTTYLLFLFANNYDLTIPDCELQPPMPRYTRMAAKPSGLTPTATSTGFSQTAHGSADSYSARSAAVRRI